MKEMKGFTLAELIGVVTLVGILCLITFPSIIKQVQNKENDLNEATKQIIYGATQLYIDAHPDDYAKTDGSSYCITLQQLVSEEYLEAPLKDASGKEIPLTNMIGVEVLKYGELSFRYEKQECKVGN